MTLRPPRQFSGRQQKDPIQAALDAEVVQEKASTLGRMARRAEAALAASAAHEAAASASSARREKLLAEAAEAVWFLMIQRELCGFPGGEAVLRDYRVPSEVRVRLGVVRAR